MSNGHEQAPPVRQSDISTVLVTGASGFIGSHLVRRCLRENYRVRALVRKGNAAGSLLRAQGAEVIDGDIRDAAAVSRAVDGCAYVFHAAAVTSDWGKLQDFIDINVGGTRNVAEAALTYGVKRFVHLSSFESFDHIKNERIDEQTPYYLRNQPYPDTKIAANRLVREYAAKGLDTSIVYPVWVYGPGDRTLFPLIADAIRNGLIFYWAQNARMSLVYIDNLIDLLLLAATHPTASGEEFLSCDGEELTFEGFCERLAAGIHARPPFLSMPFSAAYLLAGLIETCWRIAGIKKRPVLTRQAVTVLASRALVDTSKARNLLGWKPKVSLDEGFRKTLEWLNGIDPSKWKCK